MRGWIVAVIVGVATPGLSASAATAKSWISNDNYPADALAKGEQGTTEIEFTVSREGHVTACRVVTSSGSASLDAASCQMVARMPTIEPARDDRGHRIESVQHRKMKWSLPGR